ncbi:MAG: c-type cytochrome biogenesis protein CcmI [Hyphomicrobiales bacterium]|nr:c-type cytochrome biogenesis protein CcmI [Hyphomicrobiales bacterium]
MGFWIGVAVMTLVAALAALLPLARRRNDVAGDAARHDATIYRDQLTELESDRARGLIGQEEAEAARVEIARRLLKVSDDGAVDPIPAPSGFLRRLTALAIVVIVPVVGLGLYTLLGSPELPDQPRAARLDRPLEQQDIATLIAKVEAHLAANPDEGEGWEMLARVYMRVGQFDGAVEAYDKAIALLGATADREADRGEAIVMAADGRVTSDAKAAFERAVALEPAAVKPRFLLAIGLGQSGQYGEAAAAWRALLADAKGEEGWVGPAREQLAAVETAAKGGASGMDGGLTEMSAEERAQIDQMVERLAARLEADPNDLTGWSRLIRSYRVLGQADKAEAALENAVRKVTSDAEKLSALEKLAASEPAGAEAPALSAHPPVADAAPATPSEPSAPGPTAEQMAAAQQMAPQDRQAMIENMVAGLAERLNGNPDDIEGWLRLIRSYAVLGKKDDAVAAARKARDHFAGKADIVQKIEQLAGGLGLAL